MNLLKKVKTTINQNKLLHQGDAVIVGVSGGADSVALISLLHALRYELGFSLHIAHYNYNLRRGSKADQRLVECLAEKYNIPCAVKCWDKNKKIPKGSLEEIARQARFDFFIKLAKQKNANVVALAHTQNDQAETVLMRLLRGSGLQGLRGILPRRNINNVPFIRPLLGIKRKEIEAYLTKNKIAFRTDATNKQTQFFRNKVRLNLIPLLRQGYSPNIESILTSLADTAAVDYDYLEIQAQHIFQKISNFSQSQKKVQIDLSAFVKVHQALQRMVVRKGIEQLKGDTKSFTLSHMMECEDLVKNRPVNAIVNIPGGVQIKKKYKYLVLYK